MGSVFQLLHETNTQSVVWSLANSGREGVLSWHPSLRQTLVCDLILEDLGFLWAVPCESDWDGGCTSVL